MTSPFLSAVFVSAFTEMCRDLSAEHKDSSDEKKSTGKGSADKSNELSKPEPMEAEPPKAEVNGTAEELHCEGDTQSN